MLTNIIISRDDIVRDNILKSFGHKDLSKLQKKTITNKLGKNQTVYVRGNKTYRDFLNIFNISEEDDANFKKKKELHKQAFKHLPKKLRNYFK